MAFYRCMGGGSGELNETVLWTNSDLTRFDEQSITVEDYSGFDFIAIEYYGDPGTTDVYRTIFDYKSATDSLHMMGIVGKGLSSYTYARQILFLNSTKIKINAATRVGGTTGSISSLIPIRIIGLKY